MLLRAVLLHGLLLADVAALRSLKRDKPVKKALGPESRNCRYRTSSRRQRHNDTDVVVGGTVVSKLEEFPFLAWIGDYDGTNLMHFCGGTLISNRVVLTAAHCVYPEAVRNARVWVRFGILDYTAQTGVARGIVNWKVHEMYDGHVISNDIALLLLNESVPTEIVAPVALPVANSSINTGSLMEVAGWGSTDEECMEYDTLLRKAELPLGTTGSRCSIPGSKELGPELDFDSTRQLCAGNFKGKARYPGCGDSGGPLLAQGVNEVEGAMWRGSWTGNSTSNWTQVGLVSWTYGMPYPDVFTRISSYRDWIDNASTALVQEGRRTDVTFAYW